MRARISGWRRRFGAQRRMVASAERLSALDAEMLGHERLAPNITADCPWLLVYRGRCPTESEFRQHVAARLAGLPKLRRRIAFSPLDVTRPLWIDDDAFAIERHVGVARDVRHHGPEGWLRLVGELCAEPLDRSRPPWRLLLAPGTDDERFAVVLHHNHALADGQSALLILRSLLADRPAEDVPAAPAAADRMAPSTVGPAAVLWRDAQDLGRLLARLGRRMRRAQRIRDVTREWGNSFLALVELARMLLFDPAPPRLVALNRPIGPRRRAAEVVVPMSEVRAISAGAGCFPNEIYLATLVGCLRRFLEDAGAPLDDLAPVRAGMLVNVGGRRDRARLGNHISGLAVSLPVAESDPRRWLTHVQASTQRVRTTRLVRGFDVLNAAQRLVPSRWIRHVARLSISPRTSINLVASHMVPPRGLRTFAGRALERVHSWTFLPAGHTMSFVCHAFGDAVTINVLADPDAVDVDALCAHLWAAHRQLVRATADTPRAA